MFSVRLAVFWNDVIGSEPVFSTPCRMGTFVVYIRPWPDGLSVPPLIRMALGLSPRCLRRREREADDRGDEGREIDRGGGGPIASGTAPTRLIETGRPR